jgi:hypothetical protein
MNILGKLLRSLLFLGIFAFCVYGFACTFEG